MLATLAACGKEDSESHDEQSYIANYLDIPKEITSISRLLTSESTVYLCCEESGSSYIAAVNIDSGDFRKLPLDIEAGVNLLDFSINEDGGIWALCNDGDGAYSLRKFGSNGAVLQLVDLSGILDAKAAAATDSGFFLSTDADGNTCVAIKYASTYAYLFDSEGNFLFDLYYDGNLMTTVTTAQGKIGVCAATSDRMNYNLLTVDVANKSWAENKMYLGTTAGLYGGLTHDFLLFDSTNLYSYEDGERQALFNWSQVGLNTSDVHICEIPDGGFAVISASSGQSSELTYDFAMLRQGSDERTVLTMVSLSASPVIVQAVSDFNKKNENYRIELTEYFPYEQNVSDDDWDNAITNLNTKIISGDIPDIIDMSSMDVEIYYNKGIVEDLYPYIENDPEINMEDYFENVFDAMSINGGLPYVTNGVAINTMFADSTLLGNEVGWTYDEFTALLEAYGADSVGNLTSATLLRLLLLTSDSLVDWSAGKCYFDTPEFTRLLELANRLQENGDTSFGADTDSAYAASYGAVITVYQVAQYRDSYNGNLNIIGFPNETGVYHAIRPETRIGISSSGSHKEGAWEFARSFLEEKQQESCYMLPIRRESFNAVMQAAIDGKSIWTFMFEGGKATQEDVDVTRALLSSATYVLSNNNTLEDIVLEEASAYFSGNKTIQEVTANIQSRAQLYVNEQM